MSSTEDQLPDLVTPATSPIDASGNWVKSPTDAEGVDVDNPSGEGEVDDEDEDEDGGEASDVTAAPVSRAT